MINYSVWRNLDRSRHWRFGECWLVCLLPRLYFPGCQKCQTGPGFRGFGASKNACLWILIVSPWVCLWRRLSQCCCQFVTWWEVMGDPSRWERFARVHNIDNWCRWNLFWPQPLITWHFPWFCRWCLWLHYLVGYLNCCFNSGVHWIDCRHVWHIGKRHLYVFTIPYHLPCSVWWE